MQEVLGLHDNQLREKELKVHIDIPHDSLILVDKNSLQIVVRNVIDNAIKYSDRESQIRIVCYQKDQYLHCEISNQGDPIPPSLMAWINDENNIEVNALNNKSLGLYLAKDMMSRIDGDIEVVREVCVNFIKLHLPKVR
jgi:K+-sensing histidine kinase KdpD